MTKPLHTPIYDPHKSFEENFDEGPFGDYADGKVYKNLEEPEYELFGNPLYLPFGTPACPIGMNPTYVQAAFKKGFDIVTYKTVRSCSYPSHELPNILAAHPRGKLTLTQAEQGILADEQYQTPLTIANSFGVGSSDPDVWQPQMKKAVQAAGKGQLLIASCQGTQKDGDSKKYSDDFVTVAKLVKETGVKVIETNFSCPNEGTTDLLCFDVKRMKEIVHKVKNEIGDTPYIVKIAYFADKPLLRFLIEEIGGIVQGIAAINTISTKLIDQDGNPAFPGEGRQKSGVSGAAIQWAGLEMVRELKTLCEELDMKYKIFGIGGVGEMKDYDLYQEAGADVVLSAAGAMWNPYLAQEIKTNKIKKI